MRLGRRGMTLVELIFAMGLGMVVMAVGYKGYVGVTRANDYADRREATTVAAQNLMGRIKHDVRSGSSISASGASLTIGGAGVTYASTRQGVERKVGSGHAIYKDLTARFAPQAGGVSVTLRSATRVHRRPIDVEITSFVAPRSR